MRKLQIYRAIYIAIIILCLTSCSSCSKTKHSTTTEDYSYEDFKNEDCNNNYDEEEKNNGEIDPIYEKEYRIRMKVVRRVYLV